MGFPSLLRRDRACILVVALLAAHSACAPLAQVRQTKARLSGQNAATPEQRRAEEAIAAGQELQRTDPLKAIGYFVRGVELSSRELQKHPSDTIALRDYNFALARVFS